MEQGAPTSAAKRSAAGRKAETQARILDAAIALFATRGYERTSVSSIAERAHVSRSAVFWHFGDKETLFQEAFRRMLVPFVDQFKATLSHLSPRERLFELFDVYENFVSEHRAEIEPIVRWVGESPALRTSLRKPLLALVDQFVQDVFDSLEEVWPDPQEAQALSAALVSLMSGNLVLSFLDANPRGAERRRAGLHLLAQKMIETLPAS